ncbi:MAG: transcription antitermination factor NusB, partial [Actinomycetota bacterium]
MGARHKARKRALDALFEADLRGTDPLEVVADSRQRRAAEGDPDLPEYAVTLVEGVTAHRDRIDEVLATYSLGWTLDRMPAVDRNLLR